MIARLCIGLMIAVTPTFAWAAFIDGNEYLQLSLPERSAYIMGVTDGWQNSDGMSRLSGENARFGWLSDCTMEGMTIIQLRAIMDKYLAEHPEGWHYDAASIFWTALSEICPVK